MIPYGKGTGVFTMPKLTPSEAADKQIRNLKAAIPQMTNAINAVTESPMEKAIAQQDKMKLKLIESIDNGKWANGLRRVTLPEWKDKFIKKGLPNIGRGADLAKPKLIKFYSEFFPFLETVQSEVRAMADLTLEDSIARASHNIRRIADFKRTS